MRVIFRWRSCDSVISHDFPLITALIGPSQQIFLPWKQSGRDIRRNWNEKFFFFYSKKKICKDKKSSLCMKFMTPALLSQRKPVQEFAPLLLISIDSTRLLTVNNLNMWKRTTWCKASLLHNIENVYRPYVCQVHLSIPARLAWREKDIWNSLSLKIKYPGWTWQRAAPVTTFGICVDGRYFPFNYLPVPKPEPVRVTITAWRSPLLIQISWNASHVMLSSRPPWNDIDHFWYCPACLSFYEAVSN